MHSHNIHSLATVNYPTSPRRNSLPPSSHQHSGNIQRLPIQHPNIFKDFFAWRIVLAANHQHPGNFLRLSDQQQSAAATSSIDQLEQSAAATSSSDQQQQSAAAISSSNQEHLPTTAISSSKQQRSTAASNSSNRHQQPAFILPAATTQSTPTSFSYQYGS